MPMKVREVIRLLEKHGWKEMRTKGSTSSILSNLTGSQFRAMKARNSRRAL